MLSLSSTDLILLSVIGALTLYWLYARLFANPSSSTVHRTNPTHQQQLQGFNIHNGPRSDSNPELLAAGRDFVKKMDLQKKKAVVFYGSQTGTAEDYATRIAKEAKSKFGISSLVADPDEYDFDCLEKLRADQLAIFVLATYGEGEPTDNAVNMLEQLKEQQTEGNQLDHLNYVVFALGNRTYEQFCQMGIIVDELLTKRGAKRIGELGMGDDDKSMEEDYLAWKDPMWEQVQKVMGWEEGAGGDEPDFLVKEVEVNPGKEGSIDDGQVYRGELSGRALMGTRGIFDAKNPCPARVANARELFAAGDRNCVHMEFEIQGTGIRYQTGDHLAVWPVNPDSEVARLMKLLGLWEKRATAVEISSLDPMLAKVPFPTPASYEAIFRHYLDISCIASRQLLSGLARFAPTEAASAALKAIGTDKEHYQRVVAGPGLRLGECLMSVLPGGAEKLSVEDPLSESFGQGWFQTYQIPFDQIISGLPRLQPRFYSISSSPKMYPDQIHITAVVLKYPSGSRMIYGCGTNYILNAKMFLHGEKERMEHQPIDQRSSGAPHYTLSGPRGKYLEDGTKLKIPIHVRRSNFRLPTSPKIPVIMIGPGTGVAPFRAFVQERMMLARKAKAKAKEANGLQGEADALNDWAEIMLFYGCRKEEEDFLYKNEWPEYAEEFNGKFKMFTAISRRPELGGKKEYVQDLIKLQTERIYKMIIEQKGYIFICGDGKSMVKCVEESLKTIFESTGTKNGAAELKFLKDRNRLLLDVWS
ncbi:NADPH-ferrihemoprotein reductase [Puccinia graminis f. sp. tritici CRL 75-36-700-3]|uniref:NADPH--cytochrome P450 reductase n=1 Tax=Puccinia graminis f. sp. tritici (strain CRL 75-36-700-3 / race SCCL) TaxID=418459 RepID=E3KFI6_PUCGT|nr:NADPH-ferrihemoprotein reductase [Puccinia graminis f. sp. tritici CRL 75-36-700-3]EFP83061.1 NADPH-ferrihemoprotein reductase [Puccinia graminis f. sp. tritici CRL 75-36-700-3]